ncbi:valine--tRNA ligase [Flammeovirga sp. MY04]|uniref:valine--tRNA ligase n=1 Tax=Flammeovirga sp. MY04 TaxID=1191459 RepID=UPI00082643C7|nr:valine--tRNA ligase [Flammeovirga sp. MY04]ANQ49014.2 valine--tRNA ligase [Flammeovirga sp. MY04]
MELATKYNPHDVEDKWYQFWLENKFFHSEPNPDKKPFTVVIPPPNVTGVLHMGHMLNNTIQDVLVRRARMRGYEACWVPGTDHASIATEAKVVKMLKDEHGISKSDITRDEFMKYAFEWKEKYGGIILNQLQKLGASCDWDRTRFTMEDELSKAVIKVFVDLYKKGWVYRGARMVNWDPAGKTALSDEEVIHKEVNSKLYYVQYPIVGKEGEFVTIATTRPETIPADAGVCVNPNDDRFKHLIGQKVIVPTTNREIPVFGDDYVDIEFGTGCLKVTPAHDINDYELGLKHNLEVIDIIEEDGSINAKAGAQYAGKDRFVVRKEIVKDLEASGNLVKVEELQNKVGTSERTGAVIEPRISTQWFVSMKEISKPALENVMNDNIQLHPAKFKNTYRHWMENVKDWCISRQLWWGQRIPAFYLPNGEFVVAETAEEALVEAQKIDADITIDQLSQDEDVLDTWFSSWLWPISVFDGITKPENEEINYYYPTDDLVTGPDILFFWVARMIIAGYEWKGELPFKNVYLTGLVRDNQGRKMSKSLGNSPDPLDLMKVYGADGVRVGLLLSAAAGNDLLFDEKLCEQGRNFANKIWNALRLVKGLEVSEEAQPESNKIAIEWFEARFNQVLEDVEANYEKYRLSDSLMSVYKLVWDDFCSWYLEMVKPEYGSPIDKATLEATINFFEKIVRLLHPFMPFLTEEIWHAVRERATEDALVVADYPTVESFDKTLLDQATAAFEIISQVRNVRNKNQIGPKVPLPMSVLASDSTVYDRFGGIITKLANLESLTMVDAEVEGATQFVYKSDKCFIDLADQIDVEAEKEKLTKELEYTKGFIASVQKKLSNERFVANAPEAVVAKERQKQQDAEDKIKALEEAIAKL